MAHPDDTHPPATTAPPPAQPDVDLRPERVTTLAGNAEQAAQALHDNTDFRNLQLDVSMFGGMERAATVVELHGTAHRVIVETLNGVERDLRHFGQSLRDAVQGHEEADELSAAALSRLAQVAPAGYADAAKAEATNTYVTEETLSIVPDEPASEGEQPPSAEAPPAEQPPAG